MAIERLSYVPESLTLQSWKVYEVTSIKQELGMLAKSRVDALYGEVGHIDYLIHHDETFKKGISIAVPKLETILETKLGYLAISKIHPNEASILKSFDESIETILKQIDTSEKIWIPIEVQK